MSPEPGRRIDSLYTDQRDAYAKFAMYSFSWLYIEKPALDRYIAPLLLPGVKVLDAGCGVGRTILYLLERGVRLEDITGVDINPDMIEETKLRIPNATLLRADLENLELEPNSFDIVTCTHVLHYLDNAKYANAMRTFYRLLAPGGVLFTVITHPIRTARQDLSRYFERRWIIDRSPWGTEIPLYYRPTADSVNLGIEAGLSLDHLLELEIDPQGHVDQSAEYQRYSVAPTRLALMFRK